MNNSKKVLIITGDAGESFEILYASHRLLEGWLPTCDCRAFGKAIEPCDA